MVVSVSGEGCFFGGGGALAVSKSHGIESSM